MAVGVQRMKLQQHDPGPWCMLSFLRAEFLDDILGLFPTDSFEPSMDKVLLYMNSGARTEGCTALQVFPAKCQANICHSADSQIGLRSFHSLFHAFFRPGPDQCLQASLGKKTENIHTHFWTLILANDDLCTQDDLHSFFGQHVKCPHHYTPENLPGLSR